MFKDFIQLFFTSAVMKFFAVLVALSVLGSRTALADQDCSKCSSVELTSSAGLDDEYPR